MPTRVITLCIGAAILAASPIRALPAQDVPPSSPINAQVVVDSLAHLLATYYVYPDVAKQLINQLRDHLQAGRFSRVVDRRHFADVLTRELRSINGDLHFTVTFTARQGQTSAVDAGIVVAGALPQTENPWRRRNFGIRQVQWLAGNIGSIDWRLFSDLDSSSKVAVDAAIHLLEHADAVLVDIRNVPGGDADMSLYFVSHFFRPDTTTLLAYYNRPENRTDLVRVLSDFEGPRIIGVPLYVLTSEHTGSAAEAVAFMLQQSGRATVVGERSVGAGHAESTHPLPEGFEVTIPFLRPFNPRTGKGWERTGVLPDVSVPAESANVVAQRIALAKLLAATTDSARRIEYAWARQALDTIGRPVRIPLTELRRWTGVYGDRTISLVGHELYYRRGSNPRYPMAALGRNLFSVMDNPRVEFLPADAKGSAIIALTYPDGRSLRIARSSRLAPLTGAARGVR